MEKKLLNVSGDVFVLNESGLTIYRHIDEKTTISFFIASKQLAQLHHEIDWSKIIKREKELEDERKAVNSAPKAPNY